MKEIEGIKKNVELLKSRSGHRKKLIIFKAVDGNKIVTGHYDITGKQIKRVPRAAIVIPIADKPIRALLQEARHTIIYGGRDSCKSWSIVIYLLACAFNSPLRVLCVREFWTTIRDSSWSLICVVVRMIPEFAEFFEITDSEIRGKNGSLFIFRGMRHFLAPNIQGVESINIAWNEQAEMLSEDSITYLVPTIRLTGSRLIWSFNPRYPEDPVVRRFIEKESEVA